MAEVAAARVEAVGLPHPKRKVRPPGLDQEVVMVGDLEWK
jgi:hypothetical protein